MDYTPDTFPQAHARCIEETFSLEVSSDETVQSLKTKIEIKGGFQVKHLATEHQLLYDGASLADGFVQEGSTLQVAAYDDNVFFLQTLTGNLVMIRLQPDCDLDWYKTETEIEIKTGVKPMMQRLIWCGKQLEQWRDIVTYGVKDGDRVYLCKRLFGGSMPDVTFIDVENDGNLRRVKLARPDQNVPTWRVVERGLNLEGRCTHSKCSANGRTVIVPIGLGCFDLTLEEWKSKCPECSQYVQPTTAGFYDCGWRFDGIKAGRHGEPPKMCSRDEFHYYPKEYHRFQDTPEQQVAWRRLMLFTKTVDSCEASARRTLLPAETNCYMCPITQQLMREPVLAADGHSYERTAIEEWFRVSNRSPLTNCVINNQLSPNITLRATIQAYQASHDRTDGKCFLPNAFLKLSSGDFVAMKNLLPRQKVLDPWGRAVEVQSVIHHEKSSVDVFDIMLQAGPNGSRVLPLSLTSSQRMHARNPDGSTVVIRAGNLTPSHQLLREGHWTSVSEVTHRICETEVYEVAIKNDADVAVHPGQVEGIGSLGARPEGCRPGGHSRQRAARRAEIRTENGGLD